MQSFVAKGDVMSLGSALPLSPPADARDEDRGQSTLISKSCGEMVALVWAWVWAWGMEMDLRERE